MANTTNFNWETPDDTDLVKDGAAAIRTLGSAIDTSLVDLKGGTTGQILSKATNTDMDFTWITNDVGDITAVSAGTGISGGGTSGAITITNSMATEITAAGDIIVGTGSGTFDNLPIGTTGQVLTADTTVSPYKVKWATASSTSFPAFSASKQTTTQTITAGTWTKITFTNELFDTAGNFASSTFTPTTAGYYQVGGIINIDPSSSSYVQIALYKNGSSYQFLSGLFASADESYIGGSVVVAMNGTTDYLEIYARCGQNADVFAGANITNFNGVGIRGL